jgi:hypothetical protein
MQPLAPHEKNNPELVDELNSLFNSSPNTITVVKKKNGFEILFMSFVISTLTSVVLAAVMICFHLSIEVMLPVLAPVWVGATTLFFTAWKES